MQHKLFNWTVNCQGYVRPGLAYFDRQESTQKWWHFTTKDLETLYISVKGQVNGPEIV